MKNYHILSWNVNGIRAVQKKGFLDWLSETSPDILCVQETKAHEEQLDESLLHPEGYEVYWSKPERKGYSGVATFSKTKPQNVQVGYGSDKFDSEGRVVLTEYEEFSLFNIYFPNGQRDEIRLKYKLDFYDETLKILKALRKKKKRLVVSGDYNTAHKPIDLARPEANEDTSGFLPIERAWLDKLVDHGFVDTLRHFENGPDLYTWWDYKSRARERNVGWRIDYHFVSDDLAPHLKEASIYPDVFGSDHCPVSITLSF